MSLFFYFKNLCFHLDISITQKVIDDWIQKANLWVLFRKRHPYVYNKYFPQFHQIADLIPLLQQRRKDCHCRNEFLELDGLSLSDNFLTQNQIFQKSRSLWSDQWVNELLYRIRRCLVPLNDRHFAKLRGGLDKGYFFPKFT